MHECTLYHLFPVGIQKGLMHTLWFAVWLLLRVEMNLPENSDGRCLTAPNSMCVFACMDWCWSSSWEFILRLKQQKEKRGRGTGWQFLCSSNLNVGFVSRKTILFSPSLAFSIVLVQQSYGEKWMETGKRNVMVQMRDVWIVPCTK